MISSWRACEGAEWQVGGDGLQVVGGVGLGRLWLNGLGGWGGFEFLGVLRLRAGWRSAQDDGVWRGGLRDRGWELWGARWD